MPAHGTLRPTPARLRETLFNWLAPEIVGSRCLDLFAGSGALGLEALSRGADALTMVDARLATVRHLERQLQALGAEASLHCAQAECWLRHPAAQPAFQIVFLDPPFDDPDRARYCTLLQGSKLLGEHALIYLEGPRGEALPVPREWRRQRRAYSGEVQGVLYRRTDC